jgi:hypothetical protein
LAPPELAKRLRVARVECSESVRNVDLPAAYRTVDEHPALLVGI